MCNTSGRGSREQRPRYGAAALRPCGTVPTRTGAARLRPYTGQRWEVSLGLYFYQARWYDPALGRFVQPDTVVPEPEDPQGLNRFAYVRNNPLCYADPDGHFALPVMTALVGGIAGAVVAYGFQVAANYTQGQSLGDAVSHVDWGKVAGGFVAGAISGATMGAASAAGFTMYGILAAGGLGGLLGGQAAALTDAAMEEIGSEEGWDSARFYESARESGFLDPKTALLDIGAGAGSAGIGECVSWPVEAGLGKVANKFARGLVAGAYKGLSEIIGQIIEKRVPEITDEIEELGREQ